MSNILFVIIILTGILLILPNTKQLKLKQRFGYKFY